MWPFKQITTQAGEFFTTSATWEEGSKQHRCLELTL